MLILNRGGYLFALNGKIHMLQLFKVSTYAYLLFTSDKTTVNTHVCYYSLMTFQLEKFKLLLSYNYGSTLCLFLPFECKRAKNVSTFPNKG